MSSIHSRNQEGYLVKLSHKLLGLLDDFRRAECPLCGLSNGLSFTEEGRHLRIECCTPVPMTDDYEDQCGWTKIVYSVTTDVLPSPVFLPYEPPTKKPASVVKRRRTPTAPRKKRGKDS